MSLSVARSDGVTVLTLASDPSSACPPICQLLGALCYSPGLCGVSRGLPPQRGGPQTTLGALWIITGVLHIGLGSILLTVLRGYQMYALSLFPPWVGALFLIFGIWCILAERYTRPISVFLSGLLNLFGGGLSIFAIVGYSILVGDGYYTWSNYCYNYWGYRNSRTDSPDWDALMGRCEEGASMAKVLIISMLVVLITLSVLNLCLGLSSAILSFKSLRRGTGKSQPLLQEDKATTKE